ncbi:MAG: glycosyltransferase family 4 protein [Polyangiales bacterium]
MSAPRRVLFINDTARNGGPGRSLHTILTHLPAGAVHRAVLLPREDEIARLYRRARCAEELIVDPDLLENVFQPWLRAVERDDLSAPWRVRGPRLAANLLRASRLARTLPALVRERGVELIYCNGTTADFVGGLCAAATGVPALWHVRYTSVAPALRPLHTRLARSRAVARIVCVSRAAAALFPDGDPKVSVVHNAVDVERFRRGATPGCLRGAAVPDDAIVFGSSGRVLPRKGFPGMIRAARRLLDRAPAELRARIRFVVVGDSPADIPGDHLRECRELVAQLGLEGVFLLPGFAADVRPYLEDTDVVVVPSVYPDPLPRTVIEGMAYGCPVIATAVGGVAEMIRPGVDGSLLPADASDEQLASEMERYLLDPALVAREGAAARESVRARFSATAHGEAIWAEISAALARR